MPLHPSARWPSGIGALGKGSPGARLVLQSPLTVHGWPAGTAHAPSLKNVTVPPLHTNDELCGSAPPAHLPAETRHMSPHGIVPAHDRAPSCVHGWLCWQLAHSAALLHVCSQLTHGSVAQTSHSPPHSSVHVHVAGVPELSSSRSAGGSPAAGLRRPGARVCDLRCVL